MAGYCEKKLIDWLPKKEGAELIDKRVVPDREAAHGAKQFPTGKLERVEPALGIVQSPQSTTALNFIICQPHG